MSNRGRGRGGGGGRGQPRREQPSPAPSQGRGRGNAGSAGYHAAMPSDAGQPSGSSASSSSLSRDFERNLTLGAPAPAPAPAPDPVQPQPPMQPPTQKQESVEQAAQPSHSVPPASSKALESPTRPGYGTMGKKCVVRANHFLVDVADKDLRHYDVTIIPEVTSKQVCRDIMRTLAEKYLESHLGKRQLAYDGKKSAFTAGPLPFESKEFVVKLPDKDVGSKRTDREFKVIIKYAAKPDIYLLKQFLIGRQRYGPQETLQALDVVLRARPSINYEVVGRSFFYPTFGKGRLDDGLEYWKGFYQSLRPTQMGLSLNIDMSARAFYESIYVSDFVAQFFGRDLTRPLSDQERVKVKRALKGVRIEVTHTGYVKRYKIAGLSIQPTNQITFSVDATGGTISVVQYFRERYNIGLNYAFLPALQVGNDAKPNYLPMEICKIVDGQRYSKKLNERQVTALLRATCQRPRDREQSIATMINNNNYNEDKIVKDFGINVRSQLTSIDARVLPAPALKYHDTGRQNEVQPLVGQWNMIDKKMINGGTVDLWTCVNFSRHREDMVNRFCFELVSMCQSKGMVFNPQSLLPTRSSRPNNIEKTLIDIHTQCTAQFRRRGVTGKQLELLIVILPEVSGSYGKIKRVCETELGIVSQCCQPKHLPKLSKQYFENVALKINVKAGGRNTVLKHALERRLPLLSDQPTIIFGADVTHPQPGEDSSPSIAAVVASMDWPEVTKYRGLVSAQPHRQEIIQDLYKKHDDPVRGPVHGGMIRELLIAFRKATGYKPYRIIFYRDGVSEGQFNQVLLEEIDKIRLACQSLEVGYLPPITFVVVQKRHHTRLFPANHGDRTATDKSGNILPGTVVDTKICHPTEFDFYLCSHAGIQGTSRPAHYHVLFDENKFTPDALQCLTNNLCYTYARCTRSVSVVPPAYYAHLAAFRARYYIEGDFSESESAGGGRAMRERNVEVRPLPVVKDNVKDVMFYC